MVLQFSDIIQYSDYIHCAIETSHQARLSSLHSDIVPAQETGENTHDILWKMRFYSAPRQSYFISTRFGEIKHPAAFSHIFGDTS